MSIGRFPGDNNRRHVFHPAVILWIILFTSTTALSQTELVKSANLTTDTISNPLQTEDSVQIDDFVDQVQKIASAGYQKSKYDYLQTRDTYHKEAVIDQMTVTVQKVKDYLNTGPDTVVIMKEIRQINNEIELAEDGIFANKGSSQTYRNLTTSSLLLGEMLKRAQLRQKEMERYKNDLVRFKITYDSLNADSLLYIFPKDSANIMNYVNKLLIVSKGIEPTDSTLRASLDIIEDLQIPMFVTISRLSSDIEQIEVYQQDLASNLLRQESYNVWDSLRNKRSFKDIAGISAAKAGLAMEYYFTDHLIRILLMVFFIAMLSVLIRTLRQRQISEEKFNPDEDGQLVLRYPLLSAMIIVISVYQFIFPDPPFILYTLLWIISGISLTFIFWGFITRYWMTMWLTMLVVFILACLDNLVLQSSRPERYAMLAIEAVGIVVGVVYLNGGHMGELRERYIVYFIRLMVFLEITALIANLYGRYNFSKSMFIAGYANVIIGILFLWTIRLIDEILDLASKSYTQPDKNLFYINFNKVGKKAPPIFYGLLVIGWIILIGSNFYAYKQITTPLWDFLLKERTLGEYTFSVSGILVFLIILLIAMLLSRLVSFFSPDVHHAEGNVNEETLKTKTGLGSWLLLVRIFIISMGLFMAFAAAGIPMDRITIILGALGVGIGLGLQGLVNNLVSGLIIAFEKPVNVGDIVEMEGKPGVMKSIGFRSSVIVMIDGAQVVIPNGDLLNQHLVNWSMGQGIRRVELLVGVAYGTDLEKTKELLMDIMEQNERVLTTPPPMVLAQDFKDNCIEIRCNFWVGNFNEWTFAKSDVIQSIVVGFRENGIVIPFPQRDIYIKQIPGENESKTADQGNN